MTDSAISTLSYDRPKNTAVTPTTLTAEYRISFPSDNTAKVEWYIDLNPDSVVQVSTITFTAGAANDDYVIKVTADGNVKNYRHKQETGETAASIASFLATVIDSNSNVQAKAVNNVITVKSVVAGAAFTLANTDSSTPANVVVATTTASAGTVVHRKIAESQLNFGISNTMYPEVSLGGKWFDAGGSPIQLQAYGPLKGTGNKTLDALQSAQGVDRDS